MNKISLEFLKVTFGRATNHREITSPRKHILLAKSSVERSVNHAIATRTYIVCQVKGFHASVIIEIHQLIYTLERGCQCSKQAESRKWDVYNHVNG
jgi:hypothetical protein